MDATLSITINPREAVPSDDEQRVAWLERHGVPPQTATVTATADLRLWAAAGCSIHEDGTVSSSYPELPLGDTRYKTIGYHLRDLALRLIGETGRVPDALPAAEITALLEALAAQRREDAEAEAAKAAAARAEHDARVQALREATDERLIEHAWPDGRLWTTYEIGGVRLGDYPDLLERCRALQEIARQRAAQAKAAAVEARAQWIAEHGSERLRKALQLGLVDTVQKSYVEERLAVERPGWRRERDDEEYESMREPTEAALSALEAARAQWPEVQLVWLCDDTGGCEALRDKHLGRLVVCEVGGGRDTRGDSEEEEAEGRW